MLSHKTLKDANMTTEGPTPTQCLFRLRFWTPVRLGTMAGGRDFFFGQWQSTVTEQEWEQVLGDPGLG